MGARVSPAVLSRAIDSGARGTQRPLRRCVVRPLQREEGTRAARERFDTPSFWGTQGWAAPAAPASRFHPSPNLPALGRPDVRLCAVVLSHCIEGDGVCFL
jgi:hypothetical protein